MRLADEVELILLARWELLRERA